MEVKSKYVPKRFKLTIKYKKDGKGPLGLRCSIAACKEDLEKLEILQGRKVWPGGAL